MSNSTSTCSKGCNVGDTERIVSITAGTVLATVGIANLSRGPFHGLMALGAAGGLLFRGISGWCALYELLGIDGNTEESPALNRKTMPLDRAEEATAERPAMTL